MTDDIALLQESFEAIARKYGVTFLQISLTRAEPNTFFCAMHFETRTTTYMSHGSDMRKAVVGAYENMMKDDYGESNAALLEARVKALTDLVRKTKP